MHLRSKGDCAFAFQSCHRVPPWDLPARPPSSHFPLQFFLLSNRRVPLPLSSGPKAPLHPPAPVAMEMDSEVSEAPALGGCAIQVPPCLKVRAEHSIIPQHWLFTCGEVLWCFHHESRTACAPGLVLHLKARCGWGVEGGEVRSHS